MHAILFLNCQPLILNPDSNMPLNTATQKIAIITKVAILHEKGSTNAYNTSNKYSLNRKGFNPLI